MIPTPLVKELLQAGDLVFDKFFNERTPGFEMEQARWGVARQAVMKVMFEEDNEKATEDWLAEDWGATFGPWLEGVRTFRITRPQTGKKISGVVSRDGKLNTGIGVVTTKQQFRLLALACGVEPLPKAAVVGFSIYETVGATIPNVAPVVRRKVTDSGRCSKCGKDMMILEDGFVHHLNGNVVDEAADQDHVAILEKPGEIIGRTS